VFVPGGVLGGIGAVTIIGAVEAPRVETSMTVWERFLDVIADPTVASILLSIGMIAIFIELGSPGLGVPGAIGVVCLALGFLGFGVLPVDAVGLVLILLGIGLIIAEVFVPGGVLGGIGAVTIIGAVEAPRVETSMTVWERFLDVIADPTVASILLSIGMIAIFIELGSPGLGVPGAIGVVCLALGFLGFGVLPVDAVGLVLILLGIGLIIAEVFVPGGVLGGIGAVTIILGAIIAFRDTPSDLRPPPWAQVMAGLALVSALALVALAGTLLRRSVSEGVPSMVGRLAVARTDISPEGWVLIDGERWRAVSEAPDGIEAGRHVRITHVDGLELRVTEEDEG